MVLEVPTKLCPCPVVPIAKTLDQNECNRLFDRVGVTRLRVVNQIMKLAFRQITNITCCVIGHDCVEDPFQLKRDNVNDHRAATSDSPFQNARTSPLRVHRIVIPRLPAES